MLQTRCDLFTRFEPLDDFCSIQFKLTKFHVYRAICEVLEGDDRLAEVIECFRNMKDNLSQEMSTADERSRLEEGEQSQ